MAGQGGIVQARETEETSTSVSVIEPRPTMSDIGFERLNELLYNLPKMLANNTSGSES